MITTTYKRRLETGVCWHSKKSSSVVTASFVTIHRTARFERRINLHKSVRGGTGRSPPTEEAYVTSFAAIKRHVIEYLDRYFADALSAMDDLHDWALNNALALMIALKDTAKDRTEVEEQLRQARRFLAGEQALPKDRWPVGLLSTKNWGGS